MPETPSDVVGDAMLLMVLSICESVMLRKRLGERLKWWCLLVSNMIMSAVSPVTSG